MWAHFLRGKTHTPKKGMEILDDLHPKMGFSTEACTGNRSDVRGVDEASKEKRWKAWGRGEKGWRGCKVRARRAAVRQKGNGGLITSCINLGSFIQGRKDP